MKKVLIDSFSFAEHCFDISDKEVRLLVSIKMTEN